MNDCSQYPSQSTVEAHICLSPERNLLLDKEEQKHYQRTQLLREMEFILPAE
jgi:hypothetical protein